MKIVIITGSHHKNGTSAHLAAAFVRGAEETGHEVCRFDAAFRQVHPCIACETCHNTNRGCVFADDMKTLYPMDMEEFMIAVGEDELVEQIKKCFETNRPMRLPLQRRFIIMQ